jgi:hypothetical protein
MEPEEFQCMRGTVFDRERSGPAGLNAAYVDARNDPAVREQSKIPVCRCAAKGQAHARSARRLTKGLCKEIA